MPTSENDCSDALASASSDPSQRTSFDRNAARAALRLSTLTSTERLLYRVLVDFADRGGVCWPGYGRLAEETGFDQRTIVRTVERLKAAGCLVVELRHQDHTRTNYDRTNRYTLGPPPARPVPLELEAPPKPEIPASELALRALIVAEHGKAQRAEHKGEIPEERAPGQKCWHKLTAAVRSWTREVLKNQPTRTPEEAEQLAARLAFRAYVKLDGFKDGELRTKCHPLVWTEFYLAELTTAIRKELRTRKQVEENTVTPQGPEPAEKPITLAAYKGRGPSLAAGGTR